MRYKNVYFWLGIIGVVFSASGISVESLTSWDILYSNLLSILNNPYLLGSVVVAIIGVWNNPTTRGLS